MAASAPAKHGLKETGNVQFFKTVAAKKSAATAAKRRSLGLSGTPAAKKAPAKKTAAKKATAKKIATKVNPEFAAASKLRGHGPDGTEHTPKLKGKGLLTSSNPRRLLLGEFLVCFVILGAGTMVAPQGSSDGVPRMAVKGTGLAALFLILSIASTGGQAAAKFAAGFGALVTAAYLFTSSDSTNIMQWVSGFYTPGGLSAQKLSQDLSHGLTGPGAASTVTQPAPPSTAAAGSGSTGTSVAV